MKMYKGSWSIALLILNYGSIWRMVFILTVTPILCGSYIFNPLNAELNPICHLLALLGAHHIFHVSRIRVNTHLLTAVHCSLPLLLQLPLSCYYCHYCGFFIDIKYFWSHYDPGFDSASNRNEYQEHFLVGKDGRCVGLTNLPLSCDVDTKSENLNPLPANVENMVSS